VSDLTRILTGNGEAQAADELLALVYEELRKLAAYRMSLQAPGHTLQPTALVHEAWLRLGGEAQPAWQNRAHFFGAAAEAMRNILIDKARRRQRFRHGGGQERVDLDGLEIAAPDRDERMLQIHELLDRLAAEDPLKAQVVKLRFFVGFTDRETAEALGISERTVERHWSYAKAWLFGAIRDKDE
jgi:RNA polymerase sigma factor (TIGR02999 family)